MRRRLSRLVSAVRDFGFGVHAGHAIRHGVPVRGRPGAGGHEHGGPGGGPFLHWVPDRAGGLRLAGDYVPEECARCTHSGSRRL
ncbi:hypothetical protein EV378_2895 [Pseudonocardia endophytica]|uniref:Uncharacterized protein n=1 Tax=Pseudonocardia endophytica TaxID=401976 RepID=A0A4R1HZN8_PSEEN|nr:hypothetical protein EV378_2895 [Pseudonocardia endophytica]